CSIRWFVPFLAPVYYVLAVYLREQPRMVGVFLLLSGWGLVMAGLMWWQGPWMKHMVPYYWPLQAAALVSVIGYWRLQRRVPGGDPWFAGCLSWCRRFTWLWSFGSSRPTS